MAAPSYGGQEASQPTPLKRDQFITLFVRCPCWPWHDGHRTSKLYDSLEWYTLVTLVYTTPDCGITYSPWMTHNLEFKVTIFFNV